MLPSQIKHLILQLSEKRRGSWGTPRMAMQNLAQVMWVATRSRSSHTAAVGKQAWGQSQHNEDGGTEEGKSPGPWEHCWAAQATTNWTDHVPYFFWVIIYAFILNLQKEEINPLQFLCVLEIGDIIEGGGEKVLHHDGTCMQCATWKGLSIFVLSNSLLSWKLLYLASLKLFLCLSLCH